MGVEETPLVGYVWQNRQAWLPAFPTATKQPNCTINREQFTFPAWNR